MRHNLSDAEWRLIPPILPGKPRGVLRVDDRRDPERFFLKQFRFCRNRQNVNASTKSKAGTVVPFLTKRETV